MKKKQLKLTWLSLFVLIAVSVFVTSCEQEALIPDDVLTTIDEEGFKSTTGNANLPAEDDDAANTATSSPVLHMSFKSDVSEEDMEAQWAEAVEEYNNNTLESRATTEWCYRVIIRTGNQTHNGTNGAVRSRVIFNTSRGRVTHHATLNHTGRRGEGTTDSYLIPVSLQPATNWVELRSARIQLQGRDGWFITDFDAQIRDEDQPSTLSGGSANGNSFIFSDPDIWLDNNLVNNWDTFNTGNVGFGRVTFP